MNPTNEYRPVRRARDEGRDTSVLDMQNGDQLEFFVRGAICWPVLLPEVPPRVEGFVLLGGVDVESGEIFVFEQERFHSVDAFRDPDSQKVISWGVGPVLNLCWQAYLCRKFFYNHLDGPALEHEVLVSRNASILPKPDCIRVDWHSDAEAFARVLTWLPRITMGPGPLVDQLNTVRATPGVELKHYPAVWALACFVTGLERWPWRKSKVGRRVSL